MPYAVFPRTPGRDFAGVVVEGPADLVGKEVFGSSGDLGIRRDGTHATHLVVEAGAVVEKPATISLQEAAGIGVPFVTALEGFRRAGMPKAGETVLVLGVNGKVGQAAAQIATWRGARVIGVVRRPKPTRATPIGAVEIIDSSSTDVAARVQELTGGKGADIVFNTVGDPYYQAGTASRSPSSGGRSSSRRSTRSSSSTSSPSIAAGTPMSASIPSRLSSVETADVLRELAPGFASGHLKPFPIKSERHLRARRRRRGLRARCMGSSRDRDRPAFQAGEVSPMHIVRFDAAPAYEAPGHDLMRMVRLQGREAGPADSLWLGVSTHRARRRHHARRLGPGEDVRRPRRRGHDFERPRGGGAPPMGLVPHRTERGAGPQEQHQPARHHPARHATPSGKGVTPNGH